MSKKMCCLLLVAAAVSTGAVVNVVAQDMAITGYSRALHDALLEQARAGQGELALQRFAQWLSGDPGRQVAGPERVRVLADYLVLLQRQGRAAEVLETARTNAWEALPEYALDALFSAARMHANTAMEGQVVQVLMSRSGVSLASRIKQIYWWIDSGNLPAAQAALSVLRTTAADATQQLQMLEAQAFLAETQHDWVAAEDAYTKALLLAPQRQDIQRQRLFLLSRSGAANFALETARANNHAQTAPLFTVIEMRQLEQQALAEELKWAIRERDIFGDARRFDTLTKVLKKMDILRAQLATAVDPDEIILRDRLDSDYLVALVFRGRNQEAIQFFENLQRQRGVLPYYVLAAAADAYAQERRSDLAVPLYEQALLAGGKNLPMPGDVHIGLFYAYLDTGRFNQAERLLAELTAATPLRSNLGKPNPQYLAIQSLQARYFLYSEREHMAAERFSLLNIMAPFNEEFSMGLAQTFGQRGLLDASLARIETILSDTPDSLEARGAYASTLLALNRMHEGSDLVTQLAQDFPEAPMVRRLIRTREAIRGASVEMESGTGRGGGGSSLSNSDWRFAVRGNSPLFDDQWRLYVQQFTARANTGDGRVVRHRSEAGVAWISGRWKIAGGVHYTYEGSRRVGATTTLSFRLDDHWRWTAFADSNSVNVPWKAYAGRLSGSEYHTGIGYVVNESRQFDSLYQRSDFSDGNQRNALSLSWSERWYSGPQAQLSTVLAVAAAANSNLPAAYFNPRTDASLELTARYQWLTWKRDDQRLTQRVYGTLGRYRQNDQRAMPMWGVRYEHEWQLGDRITLSYGLGLAVHPYDGVPDRRSYGYLNLSLPLK